MIKNDIEITDIHYDNNIMIKKFNHVNNKNNENVIFYFCGYNDYFFLEHLIYYFPQYDFFTIDITTFGFNKTYEQDKYNYGNKFNYYDNTIEFSKYLTKLFQSNLFNTNYKKIYICGHSTGGHIVLSFLFYVQLNNIKLAYTFDRLLLVSPLTRFYQESLEFLKKQVIKFISFFTYNFDINLILNGKNKPIDFTNYYKALKNIYGKINKDFQKNYETPLLDKKYKSFIEQPKLSGWLNCVENYTNYMKQSKTKILIPTYVICSNNHGDETYFNNDSLLNPNYIIEDVKTICSNVNIKQYNTGHQCLLEPFDDNDNDDFIQMFNFMIN